MTGDASGLRSGRYRRRTMWLERIREPGDLRDLSYDELAELAGEVRDFIVGAVAENAGHLGSNLGVVELTVALHRVFDSPHDAVLWDTGHQAYVHKLVTGRQAGFARLRQTGGLSGYPSRAESPHDFVENSHASTILSYAYGLAVARDLGTADHRHVVAVIGDGSMTGGMAYEALNNLGHSGQRVIIVLNDNGRSYAPTISNLTADRSAAADRTGHRPDHQPDRRCAVALPHRNPSEPGLRPPSAQARRARPRRSARWVSGRARRRGGQGSGARAAPAAVVLRSARGPLRRPDRRARHRRTRTCAAQRHRAVGRGADRRPRDHPEGPWLPTGGGRRREAPP